MAKLTKQRARFPLAVSHVSIGCFNLGAKPQSDLHFSLGLTGETHGYMMTLRHEEAVRVAVIVARHSTWHSPYAGEIDPRTDVEALRALADRIEAEDLAFMASLKE